MFVDLQNGNATMSFTGNVPLVFQKHPNAFDEFLTKTTAPPAPAVQVRVKSRLHLPYTIC